MRINDFPQDEKATLETLYDEHGVGQFQQAEQYVCKTLAKVIFPKK